MFGKKVFFSTFCLSVFLLNNVYLKASESKLDESAVAGILSVYSTEIQNSQMKFENEQNSTNGTVKETVSVPLLFSVDNPDTLISGEVWGSDVYLKKIFIEKYKDLKFKSVRYISYDKVIGIIFDGNLFKNGGNSLMQYCAEEYKKKLLATEINADNTKISEFVSAILDGKAYNFATFLEVPDCSVVATSLDRKMNSEQILSGAKEHLTLKELSNPERRFMLVLFMLNKLSSSNNNVDVALKKAESFTASLDFSNFLRSCCELNPYYPSLLRVGGTGLSFSDYDCFFNYDFLSDISTVLHVLYHLNSTTTFGSIGIIIDNLESFISDFIANGFDKENPELFEKFFELKSKFSIME